MMRPGGDGFVMPIKLDIRRRLTKSWCSQLLNGLGRNVREEFGAGNPLLRRLGYPIPPLITPLWFVVVAVLGLVAVVLLTWRVPYDLGNYQWTLGAELQGLAAIMALVVTGTLVVAQIAQTATARPALFLPLVRFWAVLLITVIALTLDAAMLASLPPSGPTSPGLLHRIFINVAVVGNGVGLLAVMLYARTVVKWMEPKIYLAWVLRELLRTAGLDSQRSILQAVEDVGLHACERRQVRTCLEVNRALELAGHAILPANKMNWQEDWGKPDHPLRLIPAALGRLGAAYGERGLEEAVYPIARHLASLAREYCRSVPALVDYFDEPIGRILRSLGLNRREWAACAFLEEKEWCLQWLLSDPDNKRLVNLWARSIEDEIRICAESRFPNAVYKALKEMETLIGAEVHWREGIEGTLRRIKETLESYGLMDMTHQFDSRTLSEEVSDLEEKITRRRSRGRANAS